MQFVQFNTWLPFYSRLNNHLTQAARSRVFSIFRYVKFPLAHRNPVGKSDAVNCQSDRDWHRKCRYHLAYQGVGRGEGRDGSQADNFCFRRSSNIRRA